MKKKFLAFLTAVLTALTLQAAPFTVYAESYYTYEDFTFSIKGGEAYIHAYEGDRNDVFVPEILLYYPVAQIDDYAFVNNTDIQRLWLEDAVQMRDVGKYAFYGCSGVTRVALPREVEAIGDGVFMNCTSLTEVSFNSKLFHIPQQAFYNCQQLNNVVLPENVTSIGAYAFGNCDSLTRIDIPVQVTEIADNAFSGSPSTVIYCLSTAYACTYANSHAIDCVMTDKLLCGDVNLDGQINVRDVTELQRALAEITALNKTQEVNASVTGGEGPGIEDATKIQQYLAEYFDTL